MKIILENWKKHLEEQDKQDYLYHVSYYAYIDSIMDDGLVRDRNRTFSHGSYGSHSKGKIFLTEWRGVGFWFDKYENMAQHNSDNPAEDGLIPICLRIDMQEFGGQVETDEVGTSDAYYKAFYTLEDISPDVMEIWDGEKWAQMHQVDNDDLLNLIMDASDIEYDEETDEELIYPNFEVLKPIGP